MRTRRALRILLALAAFAAVYTAAFPVPSLAQGVTSAEVHFWPPLANDRDQRHLEEILIDRIDRANATILIQSYEFQDGNVADAVVRALDRGLGVRLLVDLSQETDPLTQAHFLQRQGIEVRSDHIGPYAHSNILIIDDNAVVTGSPNFSDGGLNANAENLVILFGADNAARYTDSFLGRWSDPHTTSYAYHGNALQRP